MKNNTEMSSDCVLNMKNIQHFKVTKYQYYKNNTITNTIYSYKHSVLLNFNILNTI